MSLLLCLLFILQSLLFSLLFLLDWFFILFLSNWLVIIRGVLDLASRRSASLLGFNRLVLVPSFLHFKGQVILTCARAEWDVFLFSNFLLWGILLYYWSWFGFFSDLSSLLLLRLSFLGLSWCCFSWSFLNLWRNNLFFGWGWRSCLFRSWRLLLFLRSRRCLLRLIHPCFLRL